MRLKSELYSNKQKDILNKIINILDLDENNSITLYELDNNENKKQQIMDLSPDVKKYFTCSRVIGVNNPDKCKRPYFSIIKFVSKNTYDIINTPHWIKIDDKSIKTVKYIFMLKST